MSIQTLKDIIEKQKREEEKEEVKFDPQEQIDEYKTLVNKLYDIALSAIDELINDGLIKTERAKKSITEESLGQYEIDSLILTINSKKIKFEPIGTMLIGSKGRVDVTGPFGKEKFILIRKGVKSPSELIKFKVSIVGESNPEENKQKEDIKRPTINDWEWKTLPSDSRWAKFEDVNADTVTDIIMRMING